MLFKFQEEDAEQVLALGVAGSTCDTHAAGHCLLSLYIVTYLIGTRPVGPKGPGIWPSPRNPALPTSWVPRLSPTTRDRTWAF